MRLPITTESRSVYGRGQLPYNRHFLVLASSYKDVKYTTYVWIKEVIYKLEHQCNILSKYPPPPIITCFINNISPIHILTYIQSNFFISN